MSNDEQEFDNSIADLEMGIRNSPPLPLPQFNLSPSKNTNSQIVLFKQSSTKVNQTESVYFNDSKRKHDEPPIQLLKNFEKSTQKKFKFNSTTTQVSNKENLNTSNNSSIISSTKLEFLSHSLNMSSDTREFMRRTYFGSKLDQLNDLYDD